MSKLGFFALCCELTIGPAIALENEHVRQALREERSTNEIRKILETECAFTWRHRLMAWLHKMLKV
jgi:hypothetical protein